MRVAGGWNEALFKSDNRMFDALAARHLDRQRDGTDRLAEMPAERTIVGRSAGMTLLAVGFGAFGGRAMFRMAMAMRAFAAMMTILILGAAGRACAASRVPVM